MNKNAKRVVLSGMAVIMMVSCGTAKKGGQSDTGVASKGDMEAIDNDYLILSDAQRDLLAKNNTFAINLFNKTNGMDSRVISPLSVTGLMTILANGADGDTRQEILNTLGWTGASMEEINEIYGLLSDGGIGAVGGVGIFIVLVHHLDFLDVAGVALETLQLGVLRVELVRPRAVEVDGVHQVGHGARIHVVDDPRDHPSCVL